MTSDIYNSCTSLLSFQFGFLSKETTKLFNNKLSEFGITIGQLLVMNQVRVKGEIAVKDIAQNLRLESPTVTRIIDRLIRDNLLLRKEDEKDRRFQLISLTDEGKALIEKTIVIPYEYNDYLKDKLGPEKYGQLQAILTELEMDFL